MSHLITPGIRHSRPLLHRIRELPVNADGVIENFGIFIDTHRDQPHVGTFTDDIHRGDCRPMAVHYDRGGEELVNPETGDRLPLHRKHLFITPEFWSAFLVRSLMESGSDPRRGDGTLPTSHFRDARKGVYELKSFRQMVHYNWEKAVKAGLIK